MTRIDRRLLLFLSMLAVTFSATSCIHVSSDPIDINLNVNLRVDEKVNQFFAFQDKYLNATTQPTTQQSPKPQSAKGRPETGDVL